VIFATVASCDVSFPTPAPDPIICNCMKLHEIAEMAENVLFRIRDVSYRFTAPVCPKTKSRKTDAK